MPTIGDLVIARFEEPAPANDGSAITLLGIGVINKEQKDDYFDVHWYGPKSQRVTTTWDAQIEKASWLPMYIDAHKKNYVATKKAHPAHKAWTDSCHKSTFVDWTDESPQVEDIHEKANPNTAWKIAKHDAACSCMN